MMRVHWGCVTQQRKWPDRSVLQRIVLLRAVAEMRDRSRLQVVPAKLLGQPLLEGFGTETAVIAQPDTSRKSAFCGGNTAGVVIVAPGTSVPGAFCRRSMAAALSMNRPGRHAQRGPRRWM